MADSYSLYPNFGGVPRYATVSALPATPADGDVAIVIDTDTLYVYNGTSWVILAVGGATVISVLDSTTIDLTNNSGTLTASVVPNSLTDSEISPTAAISLSKLGLGALPSGITIDSSNIIDGSIVNADISPIAAIDGSKVNPAFASSITVPHNAGLETTTVASTLNVGTTSTTATVNVGTGAHANTINIGTGSGSTIINLGGPGDTVTVAGTLVVTDSDELQVKDKTITVNKGGIVASAFSSGIEVEENATVSGYILTSGDRSAWNFKAPASGGAISLKSPSVTATSTLDSSAITADRTLSIPDRTGTILTSADSGTVTGTIIASGTIDDSNISNTAAIGLSKLALGALPSGITIDSSNIVDGTIVDADISPSAAISGSKIQSADVSNAGVVTTGSQTFAGLKGFTGSIELTGTPTVPVAGSINLTGTTNQLKITGQSGTTLNISTANLTVERTLTAPDRSGIIITDGDTGTVTDTMLATGISRSKLAAGTANHVLINDGSGVISSESSLSPTRGGTGQSSIATGDILYGSGVNTISKLPIGSANQVLTVSGGLPTWQPGFSDPMTTAGDMIIRDGTNVTARLPIGAANTVLTSNGTIPTYTQVTSAMIADGTIVNADINASAAIDGSKIVAASASVPGVVTTGTQTIAGAKTFSGVLTASSGTTATSPTTGALVVTGGAGVSGTLFAGSGLVTAAGVIEVGLGRSSDGVAFVDLTSATGETDFNARIIKNSGANGILGIYQKGTGTVEIRNAVDTSTGNGTLVQGYRAGATGTGYVGEIRSNALAGTFNLTGSDVAATAVTLNLTPGCWLIYGQAVIGLGAISRGETLVSISPTLGTLNVNCLSSNPNSGNSRGIFLAPPPLYVTITTDTPYYLIVRAEYTGTPGPPVFGTDTWLRAVRIA